MQSAGYLSTDAGVKSSCWSISNRGVVPGDLMCLRPSSFARSSSDAAERSMHKSPACSEGGSMANQTTGLIMPVLINKVL
jgi:hypothetical protein